MKPPCYAYHRLAHKRAVITQIRCPKTRELVPAEELVPFRALERIGTPFGSIPIGAIALITRTVAAPLTNQLEELPKIEAVIGGRIKTAKDIAHGPQFIG